MEQFLLANFRLNHNEKGFQFTFVPNITTFEDLYGALEAFKLEVDKLKVEHDAAEAKKAEEAAKADQPTPEVPVEVVSE